MTGDHPSMTVQRYFAGLTEQTFHTQLGLVDPPLVDYLSHMLVRFVRLDAIYRIRNLEGRPLREVGPMLAEAEARLGEARREVHRHIGDFTLFWAGLFPESLRRSRGPLTWDQFSDYCAQGKRAYLVASSIETQCDEDVASEVLERLSYHFELCAYGLREVRRQWESGDEDGPVPPRPFLIN